MRLAYVLYVTIECHCMPESFGEKMLMCLFSRGCYLYTQFPSTTSAAHSLEGVGLCFDSATKALMKVLKANCAMVPFEWLGLF